MKTTIRRLLFFLTAIAILSTIVTPSGITTNASSVYKTKRISITKNARQVVDSLDGGEGLLPQGWE